MLEARAERDGLPPNELAAMDAAVKKLELLGNRLPFPHSSGVQGAPATLRELRPRSGRSPWRAFYRRGGKRLVIGAVGPEATSNPRGFRRSVADAIERLDRVQLEGML